DSIRTPGADAAIVRIHGSARALAVSVDVTPRYVHAHPLEGGRQAVAESFRNLVASGARPLAITNCLNFGNPKKPETIGQFANTIEGMREACIALDFPVVSGNVSFYNETRGHGIPPTPSIGGIGLIDDIARIPGAGFNDAGDAVLLLGETRGHLECSLYARANGVPDGAPPPVDLNAEKRNGAFVLEHIRNGCIRAAHDISAGGLIAALAQMSLLGGRGAVITPPAPHAHPNSVLFGEDQARYVVTCSSGNTGTLLEAAKAGGVPAVWIGTTGDANLAIEGVTSITLKDLREAFESWMPVYMRSD
ncbi:MAG: AIR synthase related protein, partial [Hyphomicrobiales bacterium]|nr:AIR synthase related protein [Hyphomicrobiales bacterium]